MLASTKTEFASAEQPKRGHVRDNVLERLRHGLMAGAFVPGQIMSLRKLAVALGTSPMPVRDALNQLVAANVLEEMPNRSVRVPKISAAKLNELLDVRDMIESMAAKAACKNIDASTIKRLIAINDVLIASISKHDFPACVAANQKFHFALYEAAGSDVLMPLIESLWLRSGPTMYFSLLNTQWNAAAHKEIIEGLKQGNAGLVQRALSRDIRAIARLLVDFDNSSRSLALMDLPGFDFASGS